MNKKGFTLVELVIVIVIVGILSIVAVPLYKGYTRKSMITEGKTLIASVEKQERIYYTEYAQYLPIAWGNFLIQSLDVDVRSNKYFRSFQVTNVTSTGYTASTTGTGTATGITVTLVSTSYTTPSVLTVVDSQAI